MPLDGHSYLVAQGWSGKGNGLRKGAIAKPITVNQKKTLAGLGKDRDEAFPFWDHLFSAASQAIKVKIDDSDASDSDELQSNAAPTLRRTTTGILSNRRPVDVTPSSISGISTPDCSSSEAPRLSLIALAKREAAKRNLYSRFYRGAILISEEDDPRSPNSGGSTPPTPPPAQEPVLSRSKSKGKGKEEEQAQVDGKKEKKRKKKRKVEDVQNDEVEGRAESKEERRERKRRKKEAKEAKAKIEENMQVDEVQLKSKTESKKRWKKEGGDESSLEAGALAADDSRQKQEKTERTKKRDKRKRRSESEPLSSSRISKKKHKTS
ncbi:hypothetical protein F5878DRAFT_653074 [Lentinula raphanica]|uniref:G-patch domain-containing protein n=1 Tax=Lentinula raphanica TaxID=153919 RepID=A0AA38UC03_9AGAR|nr:hypothetical protein F5878DRAFT_653074 [Lentinula raphanica]